MLGDWLVVRQVLPVNAGGAVRGPKHVVCRPEARKLLETIDTGVLAGFRDPAVLWVMLYSFAWVSAVLAMRRQDSWGRGAGVAAAARGDPGRLRGDRPGSRSRGRRSSRAWTRRGARALERPGAGRRRPSPRGPGYPPDKQEAATKPCSSRPRHCRPPGQPDGAMVQRDAPRRATSRLRPSGRPTVGCVDAIRAARCGVGHEAAGGVRRSRLSPAGDVIRQRGPRWLSKTGSKTWASFKQLLIIYNAMHDGRRQKQPRHQCTLEGAEWSTTTLKGHDWLGRVRQST